MIPLLHRKERVLIAGTDHLAVDLLEALAAHPRLPYTVVGVAGDREVRGPRLLKATLEGPLEQLPSIAGKTRPNRIVVALTERRRRLPARQILDLWMRGIAVEEGEAFYERVTGKIPVEHLTPEGLVFSGGFRPSRLHAFVARTLSLVTSAVALAALSPLWLLIALAIKVDSAGPVHFVQERVGLGGRRFRLIKFRTMHPAQGRTSEWAGNNGHRITRIGRWLRKFRLDEIPQFLNVIRGEMNLVGPRPHPVSNFGLFVTVARNTPECGAEIPYYSIRSLVRPGITGWAQVCYGYADNLEQEIEKLKYDLYYIKHLSLGLDLRILLRTVKIVLLGRERLAAGEWAVPPTGHSIHQGRPRAA